MRSTLLQVTRVTDVDKILQKIMISENHQAPSKLNPKCAYPVRETCSGMPLYMCIGPVVRIEPAEEREEGGRFHRALKKKRRAQPQDEYINYNVILATVVGAERLWSLAKNVLTDRRRGVATLMVQVI